MADESSEDVQLPPGRPEPDDIARRVAKARVAQKLFASDERVQVGRFQLLEKVGAGGMGIVWGAWDPELERRVAIKLVHASTGATRERILAEGQALAKLSHPNVVPVFDVGVVDDRVYLVMEWVRGKNLRVWSAEKTRTDRETIAMYRAAGAGLLAAHEAGLVHRDFKPDNAVIGDDGRVRVLDFGLARSELADGPVRRAGTPGYMAPEQGGGKELTAAADQYAFGVSLREALGPGDLPAWIEAIVARATQQAPTDRFGSMAELLAALDRDPRIVWRRRILVAVAVATAGGAFALGTMRGDHVERCSGARAEIATTWNATSRDALVARLRGLGAYGAVVATQIAPELDAYAERWVTASKTACKAADAGELAPGRYELARGCLARTRAGLAAAHDVLSRVAAERLSDALLAARTLPDPGQCGLEAESSTVAPPSIMLAPRAAELANDVARARVLALAVDPTAVSVAETTANAAARLGYAPLAARAQLAYGIALLWQKERAKAAEVFDVAQSLAFAAGDTRTGVEAFARELWSVGSGSNATNPATKAALESTRVVENLARGLGPTGAFERALLLNNLGTLRMAKDDRDGARSYFHAALDARPVVTPDHYELTSIPANLALVEDDPARRAAWFEQQRSELVAIVGEDNPLVLDVRAAAAAFAIDPADARKELYVVGERVHRLHPHLAARFEWVAYDLFWLAFDAGDIARAREARAWLGEGTELDIASAYLRSTDEPAVAISAMTSLANEYGSSERSWHRWRAIDAWIVIARSETQLGHRDRANIATTRALDLAKNVGPFARTMFYRQRLARLAALAGQ